MPVCQLCSTEFPNRIDIGGKTRFLHRRKFCPKCSPFGAHNTRPLSQPLSATPPTHTQCVDCKKTIALDSFPMRSGGYRRSTCNACTKIRFSKYGRNKVLKKKAKAVQMLGGKCKVCGKSEPLCIFDFHHRDPSTKEMNMSRLFERRWEVVVPEIEKCDLLCVNCHRTFHFLISQPAHNQERYRKIKQELVAYKGGQCTECSYNDCLGALDFHHRDESQKSFKIATRIPQGNMSLLKSEADKCILLCACCHRIEHQIYQL